MLAAEAGLPVRDAFPLGPLSRDLLPLVVRGPAQRAGIAVDDELVARIVADTGGGEALPLLAFTLAELADGVGRGGEMSADRYEKLKGSARRLGPPSRPGPRAGTQPLRGRVVAGVGFEPT